MFNTHTSQFVLAALISLALAACKNPKTDKLAFVAQGQAYLKTQQYAEASIEFRNALQIDNSLADAHAGLAEALLAQGNLQEAADRYLKTAKLDPNNLNARLRLGQMLLQYTRVGRAMDEATKEAERLANEVLMKDANNPEAIILLSDIRVLQKRFEEAKEELDRAIRLNPQRAEPFVALARFYERRTSDVPPAQSAGLKAQADAAFKDALAKNPQSAQARLAYGDFLYTNRRTAEAERQLLQAFKSDPNDKLVLVAIRRFYENQFRYDEAERFLAKQAELEADKNSGRAQIIDLHARAGRVDQAIAEYQQLLKEQPGFLRGYARLAELLLAQGRPAEAKQQLEAALARNKMDTDALLVRGRIRTLEGNYRDAVIDLESALRLEPAMPAALYYTADAHLQNNDPVRARSLVNQLLGYYPRHPMGLLMLIRIQLNQGKASEAVESSNQLLATLALLKTNETDFQATRMPVEAMKDLESKAHTSRAVARMQTRDFAAAQSDLARAAELDARAAEPHINLATIALLQGNVSAAQAAVDKAVALAPSSPAAVSLLTDVSLRQRNHAAALAKLDALANTHDRANLLFQKARLYDVQGDDANTESALRQVIAADPNYLNAYFMLSDFYKRRNLHDRAIAELQTVIQNNRQSQQTAQAHMMIGLLEESRGRYNEAVTNYQRALSFDNRSLAAAIAYNNLAWLYADRNLGNIDQAAEHAQRAVAIAQEASFYDTLGYAYFRKGQHAVAVEQFNRAIERSPRQASYYLHLARALRENNNVPQARQAFTKAIQLGGLTAAEVNGARQEMAALPRV
jgi:tetratricopeptide (TPR) repeat protein